MKNIPATKTIIFWVKSCSKLKRASRTFLGAWGFENACCGVSEAMGLVGVASVRAFVCCAGVCLGVLGICALDSVLDSVWLDSMMWGALEGALLGAASCASFDGDLSTEVVCKENL